MTIRATAKPQNKKRIPILCLTILLGFCLAAYLFCRGTQPSEKLQANVQKPFAEEISDNSSVSQTIPRETLIKKEDSPKKQPENIPAQPGAAPPETAEAEDTHRTEMPPEIDLLPERDEMEVYYKAQVFRDEVFETFPVYTVQIHKPKAVIAAEAEVDTKTETETQTSEDIVPAEKFGPKPNEIWVRIKPENAREMKEIMAQTADLYRTYTNATDKNVTVINWVGGLPYARMDFDPSGNQITQ